MALQYLLAPTFQFVNTAGKPLSGGAYMEVYVHGTRTKYFCASDFNGTLHPFRIPLDSLGSNIVLANDTGSYDVYAYNRYGTLMMSRYNVKPGAGGGIGGTITSTDGSIDIHPTEDGVDLSVNGLDPSCLKVSADPRTTDGKFHFDTLVQEGDQAYVDNEGAIRLIKGWYHFTANVQLAWNAGARNETHQVTLYTTLSNSVIDFDISHVHTETIELSGDVSIAQDGSELVIGVSGMPTGLEASVIGMDVHAITGKDGHDKYYAGNGITISNENYIATDFDEVQEKLVAGSGVTIEGNVISSTSPVQVNSDWNAEEGEPGYIENKPDLDVYATQAQLTYGLAGKQNTIPDLAAIRSGAQAGASAVQASDLAAVATTGNYNDLNNRPNLTVYATKTEVNNGLAAKQDVIDDLSDIRSGAQAGSTAVQPGDLATVATTGSYDDLVNKPSIPAAQLNSDWDATSGVTAILNRPDLATVATTGDYTDLVNKPSIPAAQVNADWDATSGVEQILNCPNLATVATTGDYNDLVNTPVIPSISVTDVEVDGTSVVNAHGVAEITMPTVPTKTSDLQNDSGFITLADVPAQENADWDSTSGASEILHKPDLSIYAQSSSLATVATTGDYDDLTDTPDLSIYAQSSSLATVAITGDYDDLTNKPSIPAAQVNADWNSSSGVSQILNCPNLATVATTGAYSDLTGTPTINNVPAVTSSDNDKVLKASYSGGVGSYSWQTEQGGGSTYTAGDAIEIDNDEINVLYDSDTMELKPQEQTYTFALGTWDENYGRAYAETDSNIRDILEGAPGLELTLHIPANTFYLNGTYGENIVLRISDDPYFNYSNYCLTPLAVTYDSVENKTWIDEQDIVLHTPDQDPDYWHISSDHSARYVAFGLPSGSTFCTITSAAAGNNVTVTFTHAGGDPLLAVKNPLPASAIGDAAKVLTVDNTGAPVWAAAASVTVDQTYNASSTNAQSGTAVAGALASYTPTTSLATVATTGSYSDLSNTPSIPTATSDLTNDSGFITLSDVPAQENADWDAVSGASEILNKPVPKTLTAGTGISITESASTITIANTAPDTVASLPTNLTAAQIQAFKEALGVDETVLYEDSTGSGTVQLSEDPNHFERLGITYHLWNDNAGEQYVEVPANQTLYTFGGDYVPSTGSVAHFYTRLSYSTPTLTCIRHCYVNTSAATTVSDGTATFKFYKVVGIHRVASN